MKIESVAPCPRGRRRPRSTQEQRMPPARHAHRAAPRSTGARRSRSVLAVLVALAASLGVLPQAAAATLGSWAGWTALVGRLRLLDVHGVVLGHGARPGGCRVDLGRRGRRRVRRCQPVARALDAARGRSSAATRASSTSTSATRPAGSHRSRPTPSPQAAPAGAWAIVLGDVDLETLTVSATGPTGTAADRRPAGLGWARSTTAAAPADRAAATPTPPPRARRRRPSS